MKLNIIGVNSLRLGGLQIIPVYNRIHKTPQTLNKKLLQGLFSVVRISNKISP